MQFLIELFLWFLIEVVFWGIMLWTGKTITSILTLGTWGISIADRKKEKQNPKFMITATIGFLFWLGIGMAFIMFL